MLRYRITQDPSGRHFVLPALPHIVPLEEAYTTRGAAQEMADFMNSLRERNAKPDQFQHVA